MIYTYMIDVYAFLIKAQIRSIDSIPKEYQTLIAQKLAEEAEQNQNV